MEIKRKVAVEKAGQTEADWSAGQVSTLTVPDFTPEELDFLNQAEAPKVEPQAETETGIVGGAAAHAIVRAGNQIAGLFLRR